MTAIEEILAQATPPEAVEAVCLRGDLNADLGRLQRELDALGSDWRPVSLADADPRADLQAQIDAVKAAMSQATHLFRLRGLGAKAWSDLRAAHPAPKGSDDVWGPNFPSALLAACSADPPMTVDDAVVLIEKVGNGAADALFTAAWNVCTRTVTVPFYGGPSGARPSTAQN